MRVVLLAVAGVVVGTPLHASPAGVVDRRAWAGPIRVEDPQRSLEDVSLECCPRPEWWHQVEIERRITTPAEFQAVWQDRALSDGQKAKAMFRAIEAFHDSNPDIAVPALTYYYAVDGDYPYLRQLYEFGAATYIDFDRSLERYSGETGDLSAGIVNRLARIYLREDVPGRAVPLLRYVIGERGHEVNDHLLQWASIHLGEALTALDQHGEAVDVLLRGRTAYGGDWDARIEEQLARSREAMGWRYHLHDTRMLRAGGVVVVFLVLALGVGFTMRSGAAQFRPFRSQ